MTGFDLPQIETFGRQLERRGFVWVSEWWRQVGPERWERALCWPDGSRTHYHVTNSPYKLLSWFYKEDRWP